MGQDTQPGQSDTQMPGTETLLPIGTLISGRYEIVGTPLGEGGMGVVYPGKQHPIGREIAIKVLRPELARSLEAVKRFLREARAASLLKHPNIVTVHDFGQSPDGLLFMVMELVTGQSLGDLLLNEGDLAPERAVAITVQALYALEEAHSQGVVHRDLKPENIRLMPTAGNPDFVKVLDFGLAKILGDQGQTKLTADGSVMGSPRYMAPEQARGQQVDVRADLYAMGVILYEMLSGRPPFVSDSLMEVLVAQMSEPPPPIRSLELRRTIPPALEDVVDKALAKSREERFQTSAEMRDGLLGALADIEPEPQNATLVEVTLQGLEMTMPSMRPPTPAPSQTPKTVPPPDDTSPDIDPPMAATLVQLHAPGSAPQPEPATGPVTEQVRRGPTAGDSALTIYWREMDDRKRWLGLGATAVVVVALLGWLFASMPDEAPPAAPARVATPAPPRPADTPKPPPAPKPAESAAAEAAPDPNRVVVALESEPPGARVLVNIRRTRDDGSEVEETVRFPRTPAKLTIERGLPFAARFELDGYRPRSYELVADAARTLSAELEIAPPEPPEPMRAAPAPRPRKPAAAPEPASPPPAAPPSAPRYRVNDLK